jgi:D-alanyl-D-alanine carboxypeptidase (penicillin-binding protein 5/6)
MKSLLTSLALFFLTLTAAHADIVPPPPDIDARSYALLDYQTGDLIAQKNADEHVPPASITKVMTVYIAFDEIKQGRVHPDDEVLISKRAWKEGIDSTESRMFIEVGTRVKLIDLLRGIIIQSGNDASVAVAEYLGGSEDVFVQLMNQYAKKLGMKNTHFADASGMPNPDHYSSAGDLVILARALIHDFPEYYKIFGEREFTYNKIKQDNRNGLLWKDSSVDGIKTGHTEAAGYCLLSSAKRDGRRLIAAVMGTQSWAGRENSSLALLNWGFRFYETDSLLGPKAPAATVRIWKGAQKELQVGTLQPVDLSLPRDSKDKLKIAQTIQTPLIAPLKAGDTVGEAVISLDGKALRTVPLVALQPVPEGSLWTRIIDTIRLWLHWT